MSDRGAPRPVASGTESTRALRVGDRVLRVTDLSGLPIDRMPYSLRAVLESVIRRLGAGHPQVASLLDWRAAAERGDVIDLFATRVFLHDTNGVPAVADLAAMRHAAVELGADPDVINPLIPAELVIDHSVIVEFFGSPDAAARNTEIEYQRNAERYRFLRWAQSSFEGFAVVPPGTGIMHQVNIEHLARVIEDHGDIAYPDICLGTDSHTTMVDALGVLGWGIGGIEAEAVMLGEPFTTPLPRVIGVELSGQLRAGATTTDLVLTVTERLRRHGVVGAFVEFTGAGLDHMSLADRATIANMCPEFGATCAYFPIDRATIDYLEFTGRAPSHVRLVEAAAKALRLWREDGPLDFAERIRIDLAEIVPSIAGPQRPQDRVDLTNARQRFREDLAELTGQSPDDPAVPLALDGADVAIRNGDVAIAAITSCTNTSNPEVMVAAGLLARNAARRGLKAKPWVKTSLSPGSRVVTDYLDRAGLSDDLDRIGFALAGYGCMTCIGASGPLIEQVQDAVRREHLSVAAVLSGNRNFDGRINPDVRLNYLASPPLVVAYALIGTVDVDFDAQPLGEDADGPIFLRDLWPSRDDIDAIVRAAISPEMFSMAYRSVFEGDLRWKAIDVPDKGIYDWDPASTYLRRPPYLDGMPLEAPPPAALRGARVLAMLGDQITTDHMSPAGAIPPHTPAGQFLLERGVERFDLNTYASRRGNHEVMMRGTFANVRLRNKLVPGVEGGMTIDQVGGTGERTIYDAAEIARAQGVPLLILGGKLYGAGSSRDWGAKGPALLGVRAVIAETFERIHRSNLVGMGVLPLEYLPGQNAEMLGLTGFESFDIDSIGEAADADVVTVRADDICFSVRVRLDTDRERTYYRHGGILPFVVRKLLT